MFYSLKSRHRILCILQKTIQTTLLCITFCATIYCKMNCLLNVLQSFFYYISCIQCYHAKKQFKSFCKLLFDMRHDIILWKSRFGHLVSCHEYYQLMSHVMSCHELFESWHILISCKETQNIDHDMLFTLTIPFHMC